MGKKGQHASIDYSQEVMNTRCPVTGVVFEATELTEGRVRRFKGQLIGFCSPDCVTEWDQMADEDKEDALAEAMEE
jgi:hypothetical protein